MEELAGFKEGKERKEGSKDGRRKEKSKERRRKENKEGKKEG